MFVIVVLSYNNKQWKKCNFDRANSFISQAVDPKKNCNPIIFLHKFGIKKFISIQNYYFDTK